LTTKILVDQFLTDCQARGLRKPSIEFYQSMLKHFTESIVTLDQFTTYSVTSLMNSYRVTGVAPISMHGLYRAVRAFGNWLVEQELLDRNPVLKIKAPRVDRTQKVPPVDTDIHLLLSVCGKDETGLRDAAIILTILDTGCRVGELEGMTLSAIRTGQILLSETKGRRDRFVFLTNETRIKLAKYVSAREVSSTCLFTNLTGEPITRNAIQCMLKRRSSQAGVHIAAHMLRRAAATAWVEGGANLEAVREMLGHASLSTTQTYIGIRPSVLQALHDRVSWNHKKS